MLLFVIVMFGVAGYLIMVGCLLMVIGGCLAIRQLMRNLAPIVLVMGVGCSNWSHMDTAREIAFVGESAADWSESQGIVHNCDEQNPLVGKCGEAAGLTIYMPATMILHAVVSAILPPSYRHGWQYVTLGAEGSTVTSNWLAGYTFTSHPSKKRFQ